MAKRRYPIMYLSGIGPDGQNIEKVLRDRAGCTHRCFSYAYVAPGAFYYSKRTHRMLDAHLALGGHVMMDSSAHSFHRFARRLSGSGAVSKDKIIRTQTDIDALRDTTVDNYARYCAEHGKAWDFYVNFDYEQNCRKIYAMQRLLEARGLRPVPVFHGDDTLDWFRRYIDNGHSLIGVSKSARHFSTHGAIRRYLDRVHNLASKHSIRLHGFAMTSPAIIAAYPWWSVDSSTWVQCTIYGKVLHADYVHRTLTLVYIGTRDVPGASYYRMSAAQQKEFRTAIESRGFDFEKMRGEYEERGLYNAYMAVNASRLLEEAGGSLGTQWEMLV